MAALVVSSLCVRVVHDYQQVGAAGLFGDGRQGPAVQQFRAVVRGYYGGYHSHIAPR